MESRKGLARSKAFFGPEQTKVSLPALITLALPDPGAARYWMPFFSSSSRNSADPSRDIEEHSTSIFGFALPLRRLPTTSFTSFQVETMQNTMSRDARSAMSLATVAPYFFSGSA